MELYHYYMILCDTMYLTAHIDTSQHACYYSYDVVYTQYDINDIRLYIITSLDTRLPFTSKAIFG